LTRGEQDAILAETGDSVDWYTLLRWYQIKDMIKLAGLKITHVLNPDAIPDFENKFCTDPEHMSSWFIFMEKRNESTR
jgi:hypothetical protein